MDFNLNNIDFDVSKISVITQKLEHDGYVRIQFSKKDFPENDQCIETMEQFFIDFIEGLGGQCLNHNEDPNSIVWHVRPKETYSEYDDKPLARSQTDEAFSFHTDGSYEMNPAEYIALLVIEPDRLGGGQFEIIRVCDILQHLSLKTKEILLKNKLRINVPVEFQKSLHIDHIDASILLDHDRIRYRPDIVLEENNEELNEINSIIEKIEKYRPKLDQYTMILLNNQKFLHARTKIVDHRRHLLRIRFNRLSTFNVFSIYDQRKLRSEYITFSNEFFDYIDYQQRYLYKVLNSIVFHYSQSTSLGEEIRRHFQFEPKIHDIISKLNVHRPNFHMGAYRPDVIFVRGGPFKFNGLDSCQPKFCEINARFSLNGFFLSAAVCSKDDQNRLTKGFSSLIETIIRTAKFDTTKPMFILKSKEHGYDIHLFQQYWTKMYSQLCVFVDPKYLRVENNQLFDENTKHSIEQFILELHQDEILQLSDDVLDLLIRNDQLNYINDFRTIFIVHDKRLFSLLSNSQLLDVLLNDTQHTLTEIIPKTYVINQMPDYLIDYIVHNKNDWCIKPNSAGKGENVIIGIDVTSEEWYHQILHSDHQQWIVQRCAECVQYESMNLSGTVYCYHDQCFNVGIIRMCPYRVVNIASGGYYIRPFIHLEHIHCTNDGSILTKKKLHEQLIATKSLDFQWNQSVYVSASGGSGGRHLFFVSDIKQNQLQRKLFVDMMLEWNVISNSDVCLNLFHSTNLYRTFEIFNDFCSIVNCTTIPVGAVTSDEDALEMIEYFKPNILMGTPYRLMQLALFVEKYVPNGAIKFEKIYFACEPLDDYKQNYFKRIFHCSIFIGFYGSAEAGVFACQSAKYSSSKIYLYPKAIVHIEIIDEKIIVTNLIRKRNQLVRFDTGDVGRLIYNHENEKYGLVEIFHSQRLIMIDDATLSKSDIEYIMREIDVIEWQLIVNCVPLKGHEQIVFRFRYVKSEQVSNDIVENMIRTRVYNWFDSVSSKLSKQLLLQFECIEFNHLIQDKISRKLLKIIDKRL